MLEALWKAAERTPDEEAGLRQLDSLMRTAPTTVPLLNRAGNIVCARLHERRGDLPRALAAIRRRDYYNVSYLAPMLREEGRLAVLTGDRDGAIRAYQHYLVLRSDPEPEVKPEVEQVRAELAKLLQEPRTED